MSLKALKVIEQRSHLDATRSDDEVLKHLRALNLVRSAQLPFLAAIYLKRHDSLCLFSASRCCCARGSQWFLHQGGAARKVALAMIDGVGVPTYWHLVTWLGEVQLLLPAALWACLALLHQPGTRLFAVRWLQAIGVAALVTTGFKIAFIGWGAFGV